MSRLSISCHFFTKNLFCNPVLYFMLILVSFQLSCSETTQKEKPTGAENIISNPFIPGYFADPSVVEHEGKFYLYATIDPWGGDSLSCWVSEDFKHWTFYQLNWPTKLACTSPLSNENMVWAPSVIKKDNKFYMYISVGSEVWVGVADHPLGPWQNMLEDQPMIPFDTTRYYHVIDAEAFIDDDGKAYLYWGSGWDWINGRCFAAELNEDMHSFKSEPVEITPTNYFEGPHVIKKNEKYYLTYSDGKTIEDTYKVHYAVGDSPLGPFTEAPNSPILQTNDSLDVYGPGHHTLMTFQDKHYILYHRHRLPFESGTAYRQLCINELHFDEQLDQIQTVVPYGEQAFPSLPTNHPLYITGQSARASSARDSSYLPEFTLDGSFATRWEAHESDQDPFMEVSFDHKTILDTMEIRFEYPGKKYHFIAEVSDDNENWRLLADYRADGISGSPINIPLKEKSGKVRLSFEQNEISNPSIWEIFFY